MGGIEAEDPEVTVFGDDASKTVPAPIGGRFFVYGQDRFDVVLLQNFCLPWRPNIADEEAGVLSQTLEVWEVWGGTCRHWTTSSVSVCRSGFEIN